MQSPMNHVLFFAIPIWFFFWGVSFLLTPMMATPPSSSHSPPRKRSCCSRALPTIDSLAPESLCIIFSVLGFFDLVRASAVCKSWNTVINKSKLLHALYLKQHYRQPPGNSSRTRLSEESLNAYLEGLAMEHHRRSLTEGSVRIDQWKCHSRGVDQCRMKRGLVLTGVGDKVMRLWSLDRYNCVGEYSIPDSGSLVDFDFDESKIVGLVGTQICIWRRDGQRSVFPSRKGAFPKGLCMRYFDPEAVVGCEDGAVRVFDMYSRKCSRIIRMQAEPVTCLSLSDDQLIIAGSSLGRITVSGLPSDQHVATLRPTDGSGVKTLCFNPSSHLVFAGMTGGYASCWDIRTMRRVWETRVSPNVVYSAHHLLNDTSTLVVGGIDGVLRVLDQNTGKVLASYIMDTNTPSSSTTTHGVVIERKIGKRVAADLRLDNVSRHARPPITCLAVGMNKVATIHNGKSISIWRFNSQVAGAM